MPPSPTPNRSPSPTPNPHLPPDISPMKRRRGIQEPSSEGTGNSESGSDGFAKSVVVEAGIKLGERSLACPSEESSSEDDLPTCLLYSSSEDDLPSCVMITEVDIEMRIRRDRQRVVEQFRADYTYGLSRGCNSSIEKKTCISSCNTYSWTEKTSGIIWVAVHGMDSVCVVTRDEKLDLTRLGGFLKRKSEIEILQRFRQIVVYEIEDLADPSSGLRQSIGLDRSIEKPFSVVSVIEGYNKVNEKSGHEGSVVNYDGKKACEYLEEKMKSGVNFCFNETVKTAISALQFLYCRRKFKAKEIRVCVWRENRGPHDLHMKEVEEHLSVINC